MKNKKPKQMSFFASPSPVHGGAASKGRAKVARPIATKRPMHVILKSTRAVKEWSLLRHRAGVDKITNDVANRFGVKLYRVANVGNHLHLLVQVKRREHFQNFLRVLAQKIMFLVTRARKGSPVGKFWDALAFSRVVEWGQDWRGMLAYVGKNVLEAKGFPRDRVDWWFAFKAQVAKGSTEV